LVYFFLTRPRGLPKYAEAAHDSALCGFGLWVGSNYDYRPRTQECFTVSSFPSARFLACEGWIYELRPIDIAVASVERYRTRSEHSGKKVQSKIRRRDAQPT
jgi:hypothetical protein